MNAYLLEQVKEKYIVKMINEYGEYLEDIKNCESLFNKSLGKISFEDYEVATSKLKLSEGFLDDIGDNIIKTLKRTKIVYGIMTEEEKDMFENETYDISVITQGQKGIKTQENAKKLLNTIINIFQNILKHQKISTSFHKKYRPLFANGIKNGNIVYVYKPDKKPKNSGGVQLIFNLDEQFSTGYFKEYSSSCPFETYE